MCKDERLPWQPIIGIQNTLTNMRTQTHTLYSYIGPLPSGFLGCFVAVPPVSPPLVPSVM